MWTISVVRSVGHQHHTYFPLAVKGHLKSKKKNPKRTNKQPLGLRLRVQDNHQEMWLSSLKSHYLPSCLMGYQSLSHHCNDLRLCMNLHQHTAAAENLITFTVWQTARLLLLSRLCIYDYFIHCLVSHGTSLFPNEKKNTPIQCLLSDQQVINVVEV